MREYSDIFGWYYDTSDAIVISNLAQNIFYLKSGRVNKELMDIIIDKNNLLCFCWHKSSVLKQIYKEWCGLNKGCE